MPAFRFFRYSRWDAIPALCGVLQVAFLLWTFLAFEWLPLWAIIPAFLVVAMAYCWNLQCISHNFIHNPYFSSAWLNRLYGVLESLAIGMPHLLYHHYHLNHHAGDNDAPEVVWATRACPLAAAEGPRDDSAWRPEGRCGDGPGNRFPTSLPLAARPSSTVAI